MIFNFPTQTEDILISDCEKIALCGCHQTTFSPLYQSHATTRKMEQVLGKMDYDKERRFYHILDEILAGGENPFFERRTLWTFNRLDENHERKQHLEVDEYAVSYEECVGIGSGSITHLGDFAARPIDALSGGQRQRAWIAMALAQDTGLILLDEPTTYLDMAHQLEVLELLQTLNRDQGKTIALVIHELNLAARFSDWMIALKAGAIRGAGTPAEVMTPALLREVFGLDALIVPDPWTARPSLVSYRLAGEE